MKNICIVGLLFLSLSLQAQYSELFDDEKHVTKDILGTEFDSKNHRQIEVFKDFKKVSDTSFMKSNTYKEYGIKHLKKDKTHVLLLVDRLLDGNGNPLGQSKILNFLEFKLRDDEGLIIGYCGGSGDWDIDNSYAVVFNSKKAKQTKDFLKTIQTIWEINEESGFQKFKIVSGFSCFSDTEYLISLAKK